jgi:hypothetical protein
MSFKWQKFLFFMICGLNFNSGFSDEIDDNQILLSARPGVCIIGESNNKPCEMALNLIWKSRQSVDLCLYSSIQNNTHKCWSRAEYGSFHFQFESKIDVQFWLQKPEATERLELIEVRVLSLTKRKPERRRRRHVWSVW